MCVEPSSGALCVAGPQGAVTQLEYVVPAPVPRAILRLLKAGECVRHFIQTQKVSSTLYVESKSVFDALCRVKKCLRRSIWCLRHSPAFKKAGYGTRHEEELASLKDYMGTINENVINPSTQMLKFGPSSIVEQLNIMSDFCHTELEEELIEEVAESARACSYYFSKQVQKTC